MNTIWKLLEIEQTADKSAIRKAYAKRIRVYNPEEHPEEFLRIREAYEEAMRQAAAVSSSAAQKQENHSDAGLPSRHEAAPLQEGQASGLLRETRYPSEKTGFTFRLEEQDPADAFRNGDAIREFLALYRGPSRADRTLWTKYFASDSFLDVFRSAGFAKLLLQTVEENLAEYPPHKNFFIALSLAYALARPKYEMEGVLFRQGFASFDGAEHIQAIAAKGPSFHGVKGTDLAILNGYRDYFTLLHVTKAGQWTDETYTIFNELLWRYGSAYIKDKVPPGSGYQAADYTHRHPTCLKLLAHFLSAAQLPPRAYSLLWQKLNLKTATAGRNKLLYGRLREIALARCPELERTATASYFQLRKDYIEYSRRSCMRKADQDESEQLDVDQFFARADVQAALTDPVFIAGDVLKLWMHQSSSRYFLQKIIQIVSDNPRIPQGDMLTQKAKDTLRRQEIAQRLKADEAASLPDSPADVSSRAYFRYLLNVSFHPAYSYQYSLQLDSYLGQEFAYAKGYAKRLLAFDEATEQCTHSPSVTLSFSQHDQLEIIFHLYHVSYMRNQQPVYAPFIHFDFIAGQSDDTVFWLLLPLAFAHISAEADVRQEIEKRLSCLGFLEETPCRVIADCLTIMICKNYEDTFYPAQLTIYQESSEHLYFSDIYVTEGVLLIGRKQINAGREILHNQSYPVADVSRAIAISHRMLSEYVQPFSLETLRIDRMPTMVLHGFHHKAPQCLQDEAVTLDDIKALLADFLDGKLERLELFWKSREETAQGIPARSLVFIKAKSLTDSQNNYACICFDHLLGQRWMLLSQPEIYQGDRKHVQFAILNAGRTQTYHIHQHTERIGKFLNKAIAQVSDLTQDVPHDYAMWSLEAYYHSKTSYELDMYLLGGYCYDRVAQALLRNLQIYDCPKYMKAKTLDGTVTAFDMSIKSRLMVQQKLQEFLAAKLAQLSLTWSWKKQVDENHQQPNTCHHTHLALLNDNGTYMLIFLDDSHQSLSPLVYDTKAYRADKKHKDVSFLGVKHKPYLIHHDLNIIKEALSLLLPSIAHPEGLLHPWGDYSYAYCSEMKIGNTVVTYEQIKAFYLGE